MTEVTQLSDKELSEAINFHRRQRNLSRGVNEAHHMRQTQMVRMLEAEEARRLEEAQQIDELKKSTLGSYIKKASTNQIGNTAAVLSGKNDPETDRARKRMGQRMSGIAKATDKLTKEEAEQIDELKKSTLGSYVNRAADDISHIQRDITSTGTQSPDYKNLSRMRRNRKAGIATAVKKLTKEEAEELDEVSKATLGSYVKKANISAMDHARKSGEHNNPDQPKHFSKAMDRMRGIRKATDKLVAKEEADLDEAMTNDHWVHIKHAGSFASPKKDTIVGYSKPSKNAPKLKDGANGALRVSVAKEKGYIIEEVEELDELKKSTLSSYVTKASYDAAKHAARYGSGSKPGSFVKAHQRLAGIKKASDKLAKEEVEQIDELSPNTLHSYIKKAAGNMAGNAAVAAAQASSSMKKSSPDVKRKIKNRMMGISGASGRLADKANMAEEVELDEVSDKKLDAYRQKAFADQPAGDDGSDKYRKRKFGRDLAFAKQTGRAKVRATKEEVELDELNKSTLGSYIKKSAAARGRAGIELGASGFGSSDGKNAIKTMNKRLKGIKMASDRLAKEEVEINEAKLSPEKQERLDSLISNVIMTTDPSYYGNDTPQKYLKAIEKEFGAAIAKQVDDGSYKTHWGRDNHSSGHDKLASRQWSSKFKGGPRVTAAGKMNKQDVSALKNRIKGDKKFGGLLKSVKLPEEIELDEAVDE
jgi:hypothetical protein